MGNLGDRLFFNDKNGKRLIEIIGSSLPYKKIKAKQSRRNFKMHKNKRKEYTMSDKCNINHQKVAVIGCGFVGSSIAFTLMQRSTFSEMVLIDANIKKAEGEALDISHGLPYSAPMEIYAGGYDDLADAALIIIAAGANQKREKQGLTLSTGTSAFSPTLFPSLKKETVGV